MDWNPLDWQREGRGHISHSPRICCRAGHPRKERFMFRAIGLILLLIAVRLLMPAVWGGLESTLVQFFHLLQGGLAKGQEMMQGAAPILNLSPL